MKIGILGASGIVGREIIKLLEIRRFPIEKLICFGSENSLGSYIPFCGKQIPVEKPQDFFGLDLIFLATPDEIAKAIRPLITKAGVWAIDLSSTFRMEEDVPLVLPEINAHEISQKTPYIASPNCIASLISLPLYPIHKAFQIRRIVATTFQSASGGGKELLQKLHDDTSLALQGTLPKDPYFYGFNLFPHTSKQESTGYVHEEKKIIQELKKIFREPALRITVTSIRVPVKRAHSISLNIECEKSFQIEKVEELLQTAPGITIFEKENRSPTPLDASGKEDVFCGRIREDLSQERTLEMWVVGDQLLKGAALNAVQIAEIILEKVQSRQIPASFLS